MYRALLTDKEILEPPKETAHDTIGDPNVTYPNALQFIDSVTEAGCTCQVLTEPQRTEFLLV